MVTAILFSLALRAVIALIKKAAPSILPDDATFELNLIYSAYFSSYQSQAFILWLNAPS